MSNIDSITNERNRRIIPPKITISSSPQKINLLTTGSVKKSRFWIKLFIVVFLILTLSFGSIIVSKAMNISNKIFVGQKTSFLQKVKELIRGGSGSQTLVGENMGQINILLLGIGGEGHDGPYLTDTIILAQIRPANNEIVLTSIPRDYWVSLPDNAGQAKINAAFSGGYVLKHDWNTAGTWARETVSNLTGLEIPYFAEVDFAGFEKAINEIGGIDVQIDRTFTDNSYPKDGTDGYLPPVTFTQGLEHMDGQRALIFSRSRHAAGPEGSDFSRSQRQQKILNAFKSKLLGLNLITNNSAINNLLNIFADHFHTNLAPGELLRLKNLVKGNDSLHLSTLSLDPETKIICPFIREDTGAYTLIPCPGKTEADVKNFFKNAFSLGQIQSEKSVIWLASSTGKTQDFDNSYKIISDAGLTVWEVGFGKQNISQNIFYQVNPKPATAEFIKNSLQATEVNLPPPGIKIDKTKVDIIVILGTNK